MSANDIYLPANALRIPVVYGANCLRGKSEGFMFAEDYGALAPIEKVRSLMRKEGERLKIEVTPAWLTKVLSQLLELYAKAHAKWRAEKGNTVGFVYELRVPSGKHILMAEPAVLALIPRG